MNNRNFKGLSPRKFPKRQYVNLTHKIGLCLTLPVLIFLLGGGIGITYYHHQVHHRTYHVAHKHANRSLSSPKHVKHRVTHQTQLRPIKVKQGEHLLGQWLRKLNYPTAKAQSILMTYQKHNELQEYKDSQKLNQLTHSSINQRVKIQRIRQFINGI